MAYIQHSYGFPGHNCALLAAPKLQHWVLLPLGRLQSLASRAYQGQVKGTCLFQTGSN
jgi:hypothetical protein